LLGKDLACLLILVTRREEPLDVRVPRIILGIG